MAVSSVAPARSAGPENSSKTRRMNAGSPVESMYVPDAAIAARTAGSPHLANGPTVLTSTSPFSSSANTELRRSASACRHSTPSRSASSRSGRSERPASTGAAPWTASRSATWRPVKPVAPKMMMRLATLLPTTMAGNNYRSVRDDAEGLPTERRAQKEVHMPEVHRVSVEVGGTEISFETGWMAKQASGAVVVRSGDTVVLNTATAGNLRDVDFLPLTVDVEERMYAAGKIPGSFFKREGRAGEKATLIARMIDRPLRPLFPKGWRRETQLVGMPLSIDQIQPYDVLAMNGASAALQISDIPFPAPVGAVRIGKLEGNFVINPTEEQLLESDLDLVVSGTEEAILMVEAGANEVPEAEILDALDIAHSEIKKLCAAQRELAEKAGKPKMEIEVPQVDVDLARQIAESHGAALDAATQVEDKLERQDATKAVEEQVLEQYSGDPTAEGPPDAP